MKPSLRTSLTCLLGVLAASAAANADAQAYPSKPIQVVIPFPAGGFTDVALRALTDAMAKALGQPVVVEARPGAGGRIGAEAVARAPADGYHLLFTNNGTHTYLPITDKSLTYDPDRDFTPISGVGDYGLLMVVHPSVPARTVAEFIEYAKRNPGKINYGSSGPGSGIQFAGELFNTLAGVDVVHVPYKGIGPAMQDVIAGRCQVTFDPSAKPLVDSGRVRLLGITSARRDPRFPNAPTLAEAGLAGYDLTYWLAMFGPAGLPAGVQARLNSVVNQALADSDLRARLAVLGITATGGSADSLRARVAAERKYLQRIANDAKLRFD